MTSGSTPRLRSAWTAVRVRLCRPVVAQHRLVYRFDLQGSAPDVAPSVGVEFTIEPFQGGDREFVVRGTVSGREAYRMRLSLAREDIARLVPCCPVGEGDIFLYDCHTEADQRGRNIYPAALAHTLRAFQRPGHASAFIRVRADNHASIRGIEKAGFHLCGSAHHVSILGFPLRPFGRSRGKAGRGS